MQRRTNLRMSVRIFVGILTGVVTSIYHDWSVFFALIVTYCVFEMILIFGILSNKYLTQKKFGAVNDDFGLYPYEGGNIKTFRYVIYLSVWKFIRSFVLMSIIGLLVKVILDLLLSIRI